MQTAVTVLLILIGIAVALIGAFTLTQATQGVGLLAIACFLAILARMSQAAGHQAQLSNSVPRVEGGAGFLRPPDDGEWPPKSGERLRLPKPLELRATADLDAARTGAIPPNTRFVVLTVRPRWLFVQTEDGRTEGWVETDKRHD